MSRDETGQESETRNGLDWDPGVPGSVAMLMAIGVIAALYLARGFFIPLLLGVLASYLLFPFVDRLERWRVPRVIGAGVVLTVLVGALGWIGFAVSDDVAAAIDKLPTTAHSIAKAMRAEFSDAHSPLQNFRQAVKELQAATAPAPAKAAVADQGHVAAGIEQYLLQQGALALSIVVEAPIVLMLIYFLLISGVHFRRKLVHFVGPSISQKKEAVRLLDDVDEQIQYYLLTMVTTNAVLALVTWLSFLALGMQAPGGWGVAAGLLHFVPYLGPAVFAITATLAAFLQSDSLTFTLAIGAIATTLATLTGYGFQTWMQSRMSSVHPAVLFIGVLFFAWLWGVWGLLLGAPLIAIAKVICEHVEPLKRVADLLGS